jgi:stearoyl-CoA desaturase (delta-9 desaturase)
MIFESELHSGPADVSDLRRDELIQWQHRNYFLLLVIFGFILPVVVSGFLFDDWLGGICFAGSMRLTVAHHVCLVVNHYFGAFS